MIQAIQKMNAKNAIQPLFKSLLQEKDPLLQKTLIEALSYLVGKTQLSLFFLENPEMTGDLMVDMWIIKSIQPHINSFKLNVLKDLHEKVHVDLAVDKGIAASASRW